jgi:hypothetical protein
MNTNSYADPAAPPVGAEVLAPDGAVGTVAALLCSETSVARFMVISTGGLRGRYPVLACDLITEIDGSVVRVEGECKRLRRLPEALPIVI